MFLYKIKIFLLRIIGYDKPLRLAVLKYFTRKYKTFRPYYETILLEGAIEAKKIGYKTVSVLELGVAGGNGIIALEKYKEKIEKLINIKINPENIIAIFSDLDLYTSTKNFLNQISKLKKHLCPRTYCYFDGIFHVNHWINVHNAELLAIQEFNNENNDCKIGKSLSNSSDFKFPIGRENLFMLHNFTHKDYYLNIGSDQNFSLDIKSKEIGKIFDF